ncbi:iron dicitrate transporter FecR [Parapedobacter pyrenivorans]|uniref:Iron dicitrate transporter FecR n=1 Tax=Parapedobacter pyrenivorans TaxID=1305674 RepID=A0A917M3A3_9SPHI|nr:FecR family protein [Parapedobacter pyrenivorans]GGG74612.1 iron dicitrate transporter FecR [Parapedobacter pyrenivorans]
MGDSQDIHALFKKFLSDSCTPEEAAQLIHLLQSGKDKALFVQLINKHLHNEEESTVDDAVLSRVFARLNLGDDKRKKPIKSLTFYLKIAAAAVICMVAGIGAYYHVQHKDQKTDKTIVAHDITPGGNRATLMLEGGQHIELSGNQSGIVVTDEEISYNDGTKLATSSAVIHKLVTPKGGQYQITLHDGTKVWLNALSTLTYPKQFAKGERIVELEGEAYFEVSTWLEDGQRIPFRVKTKSQTAEVLGTQLNINAYDDENTTTTTLLEGAVRVVTPHSSASLKPGQQCKVGSQGIAIDEVDVETAVDWKNGDFIFVDENLASIMRKIARWYDVKIVYERDLPDELYNAQISRNKNLSEILRILELSGGLTSRIEDDTLFLSSK